MSVATSDVLLVLTLSPLFSSYLPPLTVFFSLYMGISRFVELFEFHNLYLPNFIFISISLKLLHKLVSSTNRIGYCIIIHCFERCFLFFSRRPSPQTPLIMRPRFQYFVNAYNIPHIGIICVHYSV